MFAVYLRSCLLLLGDDDPIGRWFSADVGGQISIAIAFILVRSRHRLFYVMSFAQMLPSAQVLNWNESSYRHVWFVICLNGFQTMCFFLESMVLASIFFRFPAIFPRNPSTPHGTSVSSLGEKKSWWDPGRFEADHEAEVEGDFGLVLFDSSIDSSTSSIPTYLTDLPCRTVSRQRSWRSFTFRISCQVTPGFGRKSDCFFLIIITYSGI